MSLILATALAVEPALLERADALNEAYVSCLFEVARESQEADMPIDQFARLVNHSCLAERDALQQVSIEIQMRRGATRAEAEAEWARIDVIGRRSVIQAYWNG